MADEKKANKRTERRSRWFSVLLYDEDENYDYRQILAVLNQADTCQYSGILHDKDRKEDGEFKQRHFHLLLRFPCALKVSTVAENLCIDARFVQAVSDWRAYELYLVHALDWAKAQYPVQCIFGTMAEETIFRVLRAKKGNSKEFYEPEMAYRDIVAFIDSRRGTCTVRQLIDWAVENGYYGHVRRDFKIYQAILAESESAAVREAYLKSQEEVDELSLVEYPVETVETVEKESPSTVEFEQLSYSARADKTIARLSTLLGGLHYESKSSLLEGNSSR